MERRTVITSAAVGLLAQIPAVRAAFAQTSGAAPAATAAERQAFETIARGKGVKIFFNQPRATASNAEKAALHLDMNMVRASIELAVQNARKKGSTALADKLQRLLSNGTAAQQAEFALGSGDYYFPEDIDRAIADTGRVDAKGVECWVCEPVCSVVCRCLGNGDQYCDDRCRNVCHKYC